MSLILSGVFNILQLVAAAACFLIIDNVGRRPLAIFGGFGTFACYTIIAALSGVYEDDWPSNKAAGWACVAMAFLFIIIFGLSFSPLGWTLPAEVFPTSCRSKGVALSVATCWLSNFIIGVAVPPMIESLRFGTYVFFACFCFASGIFSYFLIPETKGKTLEEMDAAFGDTGGAEGRQVMKNELIMARRASAAAGKTA
jgi:MFS family permease